jgi:hypothetical protein
MDNSSFFLTLDWTETWIEIFGKQFLPEFIIFWDSEVVVGICMVVKRTVRYGPVPVRIIYFNASGEDEADGTCIEYNNLLALPGYEGKVGEALGKFVRKYEWDEIHCNGFMAGPALDALSENLGDVLRIDSVRSSRYIDLCALRSSGKDYIATLGSSTRSLIRRNFRHYETGGELIVRLAADSEAALKMLGELADLHQERWISLGKPGAFSSDRFRLFHETLIRRTFGSGAIQLFQVQAGNKTLGYLYNFVHAGRVYFYQSGFNYSDKQLSPGLVVHACAIKKCIDQGLMEYDFLAGDSQYKRSLSGNQRDLNWAILQRRNWKMRTIVYLRKGKRFLESKNSAR